MSHSTVSDQFARIAEIDHLMKTTNLNKIASAVHGYNTAELASVAFNPLLTPEQCLTLFGKLPLAYDRIRLLKHESFPASSLAGLAKSEVEPTVLEAIYLHPKANDQARFIAWANKLLNSQVSVRWAG
jgi:hypothetical protein